HGPTLAALAALEGGSPPELVRLAVARLEPVELREVLRAVGLDAATARQAAEEMVQSGELVSLEGGALRETSLLYTAAGFEALTKGLRETLAAYHRQSPLRQGMPREELRSRLGLEPRAFDQALALWAQRGEAKEAGQTVALPQHEPRPSPAQEGQARAFLAALRAQPYSPPTDGLPEEALLAYLEDRGEVVRAGEVAFATEAYREMAERIVAHLRERGTVTLAQVRDMFGTSRKYAQALLEHLDEQRVTRRVGDERVLR
ncbi:MAG TPA: SelB C-terminal domain-containing protein, partial [Dehalococcoidia bacterium]|nr:SelB C-terminal domain-containing protein [Dehalococcoidia bacterium]